VQFSLLASLTFLVGSLGRAAIGAQIDANGYAPVFFLTAGLGLIAVVLTALEWARQARAARISPETPG
jgi:PAT family beta-lactamase induction signal transducer AmpG